MNPTDLLSVLTLKFLMPFLDKYCL